MRLRSLLAQEIYNRMYGSGCTVDSDLQELCLWSKEIINWKISQREAALRRVEDANLLEMRKSKCQEVRETVGDRETEVPP